MMDDYDGERFILYSFFFLPVITKELATGESLMKKFKCIPKGELFDDRMAKAVKITKRNRKRLIEDDMDPAIEEVFPIAVGYAKEFEWVERSW